MNAVIERDADHAIELHNMHLRRTSDMVREVLRATAGEPAVAARRKSRRATSRQTIDVPSSSTPATLRSLGRRGER
jgi:hypothetical protein